ncbi:MAG TPA: molybdopterin-dependent oxidoreductase [Sulfurimonas sp.]|uniref:molybdopterin-dependent oxidoreductase n=1 Tax=Sulfurimonas sp. TaxID=2022749 RepID=UPI002BB9BE36|nr:molybdopterin-dependent oxidoreductase [Sulfurimonas sp.]HUH42415.1 molybdopterin-dependent oxidoreductase [Sulfurimonas sp.]
MKRRDFFKTTAAIGTATLASSAFGSEVKIRQPIDNGPICKYNFPEKRPMITHSDRPPLLEAPRNVFTQTITPNDEFFVRWHMPEIPTYIDTDKFTISVNGLVEKDYIISLKDLKNDFEQVEVTAVLQCGGNSRSAFLPITGGIQWGSGAMGCAKWKGVRLSDLLHRAGLKEGAQWIGFNGMETAAYYKSPGFVRELNLHELDDHVIVAYEMNGEDLPYLNGYPVRLILPGYYSDSWVKMLKNITVTSEYQHHFFMDEAYRVPDNATESEMPDNLVKKTKPITKMNIKSVIGFPQNNSKIALNSQLVVRGVAFDSGIGIKDVLISLDGGKTWEASMLDNDRRGRYAYRGFRFSFKPKTFGTLEIMAKAVDKSNHEQPLDKDILWNSGGYKYNGIDVVTVEVV